MERKMASIRRIADLQPIEGADKIEVATIDGWKVVVKKGEFTVGELAVYLEIDSWVPNTLAPFLTQNGREPREFNGVKGERLRTVKLRGQISQGLLLGIDNCVAVAGCWSANLDEGADVSEWLNIQKWELPISPQMQGKVRGNFPSRIPKSDQERIQNLSRNLETWIAEGLIFEITEKLDGTSCTFYLDSEGEFHVCSRNIDLKEDEDNLYWKMARKYSIEESMRKVLSQPDCDMTSLAFQGEIIGPGVQGNKYNMQDHHFFVYTVMNENSKCPPGIANQIVEAFGLNYVPVLMHGKIREGQTVQTLLTIAEGKTVILSDAGTSNEGVEREGIVFKCHDDTSISFKAISNKWLLANE